MKEENQKEMKIMKLHLYNYLFNKKNQKYYYIDYIFLQY